MPSLVRSDQGALEERRGDLRAENPQAPTVRLFSLAFLRDTKVGRAVTLASSLEEDEWDGLEEIELWPEEAGA